MELVRGGEINYFFIHTTWGIIECEKSGLEDVKKLHQNNSK